MRNRTRNTILWSMLIVGFIIAGIGFAVNEHGGYMGPHNSAKIAGTSVAVSAGKAVSVKPSATPDIPKEVWRPKTADQIADQLHCGHFVSKSLGDAKIVWGMVSGGTCVMDGQKYGINVFNTTELLHRWLRVSKQYGVDPKWETKNAVIYPSVLG